MNMTAGYNDNYFVRVQNKHAHEIDELKAQVANLTESYDSFKLAINNA